jgi:6-phosphogluconate dehydrogenase
MKRIAVLGMGIMGRGIALNLQRRGFSVAVWNRTAARVEAFRVPGTDAAGTREGRPER